MELFIHRTVRLIILRAVDLGGAHNRGVFYSSRRSSMEFTHVARILREV